SVPVERVGLGQPAEQFGLSAGEVRIAGNQIMILLLGIDEVPLKAAHLEAAAVAAATIERVIDLLVLRLALKFRCAHDRAAMKATHRIRQRSAAAQDLIAIDPTERRAGELL